jgi:hypothetical protein
MKMKNKLIILMIITFVILLLNSCVFDARTKTPKSHKVVSDTHVVDELLMTEVSHGLHRITLDDGTTVLIYRGVESCTMIQLK